MIELCQVGMQYGSGGPGPHLLFQDTCVERGGTLVLLGDSGSGKSTLLSILAGLLPPTQGHVLVGGVNPYALPAAKRDAWRGSHVGLLPQQALLSPHLSVWQHVALPFVCAGLPPDNTAINHVLTALGLQALLDQPARTLSGGQAQRVALARALVRQPQVLLADEPTASLDDTHTAAVLQLLQTHAAQATLVIATHDMRVVQHMAAQRQATTLMLRPMEATA